jgi:RNA polymerase sigma factor (sigma-70 family)
MTCTVVARRSLPDPRLEGDRSRLMTRRLVGIGSRSRPTALVGQIMSTPQGDGAPESLGGDGTTFADFFRLIRTGDESAAAELVRRYEPALRLEIRLRLLDPKLRRLLDPADISQSVLASFFIRAATGQFDLDSPANLMALLRTMARNKVAHQARKQQTLRRDVRRDVSLGDDEFTLVATDPSPSRLAIGREMLEAFRGRLSLEERRMADLRSQGFEWPEIAKQLGGTAQARRKQLARAVERVAEQLGLDGTSDADD